VVDVAPGPEPDSPGEARRGLLVGYDERGGAVGYERAIRSPERPRDIRVLVADKVTELESEILAKLRVRVRDAVPVVLGRNAGELRAAVAVALEVALRDPAEDASEPAFDVGLL